MTGQKREKKLPEGSMGELKRNSAHKSAGGTKIPFIRCDIAEKYYILAEGLYMSNEIMVLHILPVLDIRIIPA